MLTQQRRSRSVRPAHELRSNAFRSSSIEVVILSARSSSAIIFNHYPHHYRRLSAGLGIQSHAGCRAWMRSHTRISCRPDPGSPAARPRSEQTSQLTSSFSFVFVIGTKQLICGPFGPCLLMRNLINLQRLALAGGWAESLRRAAGALALAPNARRGRRTKAGSCAHWCPLASPSHDER